jgi:hypothetical protein
MPPTSSKVNACVRLNTISPQVQHAPNAINIMSAFNVHRLSRTSNREAKKSKRAPTNCAIVVEGLVARTGGNVKAGLKLSLANAGGIFSKSGGRNELFIYLSC